MDNKIPKWKEYLTEEGKLALYSSLIWHYMETLDFETGKGYVDELGYAFLTKEQREQMALRQEYIYDGLKYATRIFRIEDEYEYVLDSLKQWIVERMAILEKHPTHIKPVRPHHAWLDLFVHKRYFTYKLKQWIKDYRIILDIFDC